MNNSEITPVKINVNSLKPIQPAKGNGPGLIIALALVGILLLTAIVLFSVFLSNIDHKKKNIINTQNNSTQGNTTIENTTQGNNTVPYADKYIDLHFHLDGSITVDIAKQLAALQNITLPTNNDTELESLLSVPDDCKSLNDFLKCFDLPLSLLQTPEGLSESVRLVGDNIASQGVIYVEIRYAPQLHCEKGMTQEDAIIAALDGLNKTKIKANLILCLMRGEGNEAENEETLELAKKYLVKDGGVVAIDLAGAEALFNTTKYKDIFAKAKEYNIPFTIHAGEADGAYSVQNAIEYGAVRIGHGVRSYEDPKVVNLVKDEGIFLEMCPTSSRLTHSVEDMSTFPFMDYLEKGIKVTLNTDDMAIERTTLEKEYRYMEQTFNLTGEQEKTILLNSVNAAFTTDEVKKELKETLNLQ